MSETHGTSSLVETLVDTIETADGPGDGYTEGLLQTAASRLGVETAYLTRVSPQRSPTTQSVIATTTDRVPVGRSWRLAESPCRNVLETEELVVTRFDGSVPVESRWYVGLPLFMNGEVAGTLCFRTDTEEEPTLSGDTLTELRLLGRLIEREFAYQAAVTGRAVQSKRLEWLASTASHDLRNPLTVANGRLQLAQDDCESEHLAPIHRSLDRLGMLIDGLVSSVREGETPDDLQPVDLSTIELDAAAGDLNESLVIRADRDAVRRLLTIIGDHAGDQDVGITLGALPDGFYLELVDGSLPDPHPNQIFEWDHDAATVGDLPIAHQICESHGWTIDATPTETGGCRFEITGVERFDT